MYSDPERQKEENRRRMREKRMDPAYREKMAEYMKNYLPFYNRLKKYGITKEEYLQKVQEQDGRCAICKVIEPNLRVDHNHETNVIRGLLCDACNLGLGKFKDNLELLKKAVEYLSHG